MKNLNKRLYSNDFLMKLHVKSKDPKHLPDKIINDLGYKISDLSNIREKQNTLEEFRNLHPPEICIWQCKKTYNLSFKDGYSCKIKNKQCYTTDLLTFIDLYHKGFAKPTNKFLKNYKLYKGEDLTNKKILCWLYGGGMGDILFVQPILYYLKKIYPSCHITFAVPDRSHSMVKNWKFNKIISTPFHEKYFLQVDYHINFDGIINKCKEAEKVNIYKLLAKWINTNIPIEELVPKQNPDTSKVFKWSHIIEDNNIPHNFMILQLKTNTVLRTPRDDFWINLTNKLIEKDIPIVFTDRSDEYTHIEEIKSKTNKPEMIFNVCKHSKDIGDAIALLSHSTMITSVDTGLIHIGASLDKPCFGIYGPFSGKIRLETYPKTYWIDAQCECAPCYIHGYTLCDNAIDNAPKCYDTIDINDLANKINILWKEAIKLA